MYIDTMVSWQDQYVDLNWSIRAIESCTMEWELIHIYTGTKYIELYILKIKIIYILESQLIGSEMKSGSYILGSELIGSEMKSALNWDQWFKYAEIRIIYTCWSKKDHDMAGIRIYWSNWSHGSYI